ncbi:MAG: GHKL domain-containing protein [Bradymonadaceae bacterium]|nr:GHKL domain-containing protein [Lujinxingiaceae bacterium]
MAEAITVLVIQSEPLDQAWLEALIASAPGWSLRFVATVAEALSVPEQAASTTMVCLPLGSGQSVPRALMEQLIGLRPDWPLVCLLLDDDADLALAALGAGATDCVFASALKGSGAIASWKLARERHRSIMNQRQLERVLKRRNQDMDRLGLLTRAITSTVDRDMILDRALEVFAGICTSGGAAFCELSPALDELVENPEAWVDENPGRIELHCVGSTSEQNQPFNDWLVADMDCVDLMFSDKVTVLQQPISDRSFAALEPLWRRFQGSTAALVPVWALGRPLGLLVVYATNPSACDDLKDGEQELRAMARLLGATLQNARLFKEVDDAYLNLRNAQKQLVHAEKFAAMGVLSAEIAHEINNPASFVISNLSVMLDYVDTIGSFIERLATLEHADALLRNELQELEQAHEITFLREDLNAMITRSLAGMQRIHQIVQDLRFFSHGIAEEPGWVDLEHLITSALHLVSHDAKFRARLDLDFEGLPQVFSDANKLSQVLLNLLVNAAQAIDPGRVEENFIRVTTRQHGEQVVIAIEDSGTGIDPANLGRIFEPFFTTKDRGSATGLGLSISLDILRSLGGELRVKSELGQGSCFEIHLPIQASQFGRKKALRESGNFKSPPRRHGQGSQSSEDGQPSGQGGQ